MKLIPQKVLDRKQDFLSLVKVLENGCWEWQGYIHPRGYGNFSRGYKAHRVSYAMFNGHDPSDLYICHHCDFPKCVNPEHLFAGTQSDNMRDKVNKNRQTRGFESPVCIMTKEKLSEIVDFHQNNFSSIQKTAKKFGLKYTHCRAWLIKSGCAVGKLKEKQKLILNKAIEDYLTCEDSANVVGKRHGITSGPICNWLKKRGFKVRNSERYHPNKKSTD